ncbi:GntR family transcriptional regulator [Mumia flava]|uniref:GntR family transcriptional regulator n=1 Tax=Mumia flava TaxID=1348852 RepID=A0A0B2BC36_9ACTN|nr:GntR family transcriptional regulator [Mumia flava]PJJ53970.1 GntR family transcriptional regulator [Mumia flava]
MVTSAQSASPPDGPPPSVQRRLQALWDEVARAGGVMPSEPALAATLSMSRPALREALVRLEERGYIHRRKGADTVVNTSLLDVPARFDQRIDQSELIAAMGRTPTLDVLASEISAISSQEAREYELPPETQVLRVAKRWSADGLPVMLARDAIRIGPGIDPDDVDPARSLFEIAPELTGERIEWEIAWPSAAALGDQDAERLDQPSGEPVLTLDATGVSRLGRVGYWTSEIHLPGAFRYAMIHRTGRT